MSCRVYGYLWIFIATESDKPDNIGNYLDFSFISICLYKYAMKVFFKIAFEK